MRSSSFSAEEGIYPVTVFALYNLYNRRSNSFIIIYIYIKAELPGLLELKIIEFQKYIAMRGYPGRTLGHFKSSLYGKDFVSHPRQPRVTDKS